MFRGYPFAVLALAAALFAAGCGDEDAADPALIYVASLSQVAYGEMPDVVRLDPLWRIVDFD